MSKETKSFEIKKYTHEGIDVLVEIDYEEGKISLLQQRGELKRWIFAKRSLEYMAGWQTILDAMKHAVEQATKELRKHEDTKEKASKKRDLAIARAIAEKDW